MRQRCVCWDVTPFCAACLRQDLAQARQQRLPFFVMQVLSGVNSQRLVQEAVRRPHAHHRDS